MKLVICGGRDYQLTDKDFAFLDRIHRDRGVSMVVSGGAPGADSCGETWAVRNNIPVRRFPANWRQHGRAAGPIRNKSMAQFCDYVVAFPGGRGTDSMVSEARKLGKTVWRLVYET